MPPTATITFDWPSPTELLVSISGVVDRVAVEQLEQRLSAVRGSGVRVVVVDLSAAPQCSYRVLGVLDRARADLLTRGAVLHLRGVSAPALTGLAQAELTGALEAYRASLHMAQPGAPWEPGAGGAPAQRTEEELRLVRACADLAAQPTGSGGGRGAGAREVAERLVEQGMRLLRVTAAVVVLRDREHRPRVVSASSGRARFLESGGVTADEGPAVECLRRGEPVSALDVGRLRDNDRWAVYAALAARHGFAATRALPIRSSAAQPGRGGTRTTGAFVLLADAPGPMAAADLGVAQGLADLAAVAFAAAARRTPGRSLAAAAAERPPAVPGPVPGPVVRRIDGPATAAHERGVTPPVG